MAVLDGEPGRSGKAGAKGLGERPAGGTEPDGIMAPVWLAIMPGSLPRGSCTMRGSWGEIGPWNSAGQARNTSKMGTAS
jgi:hypothetical protein